MMVSSSVAGVINRSATCVRLIVSACASAAALTPWPVAWPRCLQVAHAPPPTSLWNGLRKWVFTRSLICRLLGRRLDDAPRIVVWIFQQVIHRRAAFLPIACRLYSTVVSVGMT